MTSQAEFLKNLFDNSTAVKCQDGDTKIDTSYGRLFQIKKDVSDLKNALENITKFGLSLDEITEVNESTKYADELKNIVNHPSITTAAKLKTAYETGALQKLENLLDDDSKPNYTSQHTGKIEETLLSARLTAPPETPVLPTIRNKDILKIVFIHSSASNDSNHESTETNERLEFLGTSALNHAINLILFKRFPDYKLNELERLRGEIISDKNLSKWSYEYGFDRLLLSDLSTKGQHNLKKVYADGFKAYVGGLHQDKKGDITQIESWLCDLIEPFLADVNQNGSETYSPPRTGTLIPEPKIHIGEDISKNSKNILYSLLNPVFVPSYDLIERTNSPHDPIFTVACVVHGEVIGVGTAGSLKKASSKAAEDALQNNSAKVNEYADLKDRVKAKGGKLPPKKRALVSDQLEEGIYKGDQRSLIK